MSSVERGASASQQGFSDDFLVHTQKVWEPILGRPLSIEESREIADNLVSLELFLRELKKKYG